MLACSALKNAYRARLVGGDAGGRIRFVYLAGTPELLRARLAQRPGHFMKPGMLDSQLATLEAPADARRRWTPRYRWPGAWCRAIRARGSSS